MIKLSLIISHMSFMINQWNVPHHVLNNDCFKYNSFRMTLGILIIFFNYSTINHKLSHIFEISSQCHY